MATVTLTNLSGGLIVCDLKCRDKDKNKVSKTPVKGKPAEKAESDKKEEKQNGNV